VHAEQILVYGVSTDRAAPRPRHPVHRLEQSPRGGFRPTGPGSGLHLAREPMRNPAKRHVTMRTRYRWHMWRIDPKGSHGLIGRTVSQPEVRTLESLAALPLFSAWWQDASLRRRCFHWLGFKDLRSHPAPATKNTHGVPTCAEDSLDFEVVKARIDRFRRDPQAGLR
jgi:hypothetical protein